MTRARVVRMIIYEGDAVSVLKQVDRSVHGTKNWGGDISISAETLQTDVWDTEPPPEPTATDRLLAKIRREKQPLEVLWKPTQTDQGY